MLAKIACCMLIMPMRTPDTAVGVLGEGVLGAGAGVAADAVWALPCANAVKLSTHVANAKRKSLLVIG